MTFDAKKAEAAWRKVQKILDDPSGIKKREIVHSQKCDEDTYCQRTPTRAGLICTCSARAKLIARTRPEALLRTPEWRGSTVELDGEYMLLRHPNGRAVARVKVL